MRGCVTRRFSASAIVLLMITGCRPPVAAAQDTPSALNVVYAEAFGTALFFGSVNYEQPAAGGLVSRASSIPSLRAPDLVYWAGLSLGAAF